MPREYAKYIKPDQQTKIGIKLADNKFFDASGVVRSIEGDRLTLELIGNESAGERAVEPGTDVFIATWTGWSLCRCSAVLTQRINGRQVSLRLTGPVVERQNREYFRLDVSIPVSYTIPARQLLPDVHAEWAAVRGAMQRLATPVLMPCPDGFKVVGWDGGNVIEPQRVNLSGGGMRFKTLGYIAPETLVVVDLFLPLIPPRVIHTVAETLRCNEIVLGRGGNNYITAMRFHFINERDRETIIAFIFAEQRRILSSRAGKLY